MKNVEDIYPLSPMQEVMLLHAQVGLRDDMLLNQFCYEISGELDEIAFTAAWKQVSDRHPALRSCFVWQGVKQALQIVRQEVTPQIEVLDWRVYSPQEHGQGLLELQQRDRDQRFDLGQAPLQRFTLIRLAGDRHQLLWTSHHLVLDRWCLATLYQDFCDAYRATMDGQRWRPPPVRPFRDYINWIRQQERGAPEQYWRKYTQGLTVPTLLTEPASGRSHAETFAARESLGPEATGALRRFARSLGVTASVVVQGALALQLGRICNQSVICFGSVVSGRPPGLPGVESIVGSFINNVPVVVALDPDASLSSWFKTIQLAQSRRSGFDHVAITDIQRWSPLPRNSPVFDTLLVWLSDVEMPVLEGLEFSALEGDSRTAYPLTLSVFDRGEELLLQTDLKQGFGLRREAETLIAGLRERLHAFIAAETDARLSEFVDLPPVAALAGVHGVGRTPSTGKNAPFEARLASGEGREALDPALLEDTLVLEWRALLGDGEFRRDDNFFECGGNSLLAARLHANVETVTRLSLPLIALFRQPTIRGMAATLSGQDWPLCAGLAVPVQTEGSLPPLFCVASPDVNTLGYVQLSHHLSDQQPLYVLQSPPDSDSVRRLDPIELPAVAGSYVEALRQVRAEGPYHLLGMCTGAHLALEMARQLEASGEQVAFLGVINTWAFFTVSQVYRLTRVVNRIQYYRSRLADLGGRTGEERAALIRRALLGRFGRSATTVPATAPGRGVDDSGRQEAGVAIVEEEDRVADSNHDAWIEDVGWTGKRTDIEKTAAAITVFRIRRQQYWRIRDVALGWGAFADQVEVQHLQGASHDDILRQPGVCEVAERVSEQLRRAQVARQEVGGV